MNRIKELRNQNNLKQAELAKLLNVSPAALSGYETGKFEAELITYEKMAKIFDVSLDYLLGRDDAHSSEGIRIPVLGSVPAGVPLEAIEDVVDWEELPKSMATGGREYFALQVKGDSMWPDYLPGDTVIVRKQPTCQSGEDCVVYVNGYEATLKQVRLNDDHSLTIVPRNRSYPPRTYSPEEIESLPVSIAGVVVELRRKIKK